MEFFITPAWAQEASAAAQGGGLPHWAFYGLALLLVVFAIVLILRKIEVSGGQAIVLGVAVALAVVPIVAEFEWSDDGFKFTTKTVTADIAGQVAGLVEQEQDTRKNLKATQEALKAVTQRVISIERAARAGANGNAAPEIPGPASSGFNPLLLDQLIRDSDAAIAKSDQRLEELDVIQEQLKIDSQQQ